MATMQQADPDWRTVSAAARSGRRVTPSVPDARSPRLLAALIEGEIIPRLLMAHRDDPLPTTGSKPPSAPVEPRDVDTLAPLVLTLETHALLRHVEGVIARGVEVKAVFLDLLAPVARRLGEYWEADECDFVDVTMGLWRLQEVVHEIAARTPARRMRVDRHALFAPMPGEQHSFGTIMVEELFRCSGWNTVGVPEGDATEIVELVAARAFDLVGLTVMTAAAGDDLPEFIARVRRASLNPAVVIMVGGAAMNADPELAMRVGADGTAPNGDQAVSKAEMLVDAVARRSAGRG